MNAHTKPIREAHAEVRVPSYATFVDLERQAAADVDALAFWRDVLTRPEVAWRLALAPGEPGQPPSWHRHDHLLDGPELENLRQAAEKLQVSLRTLLWSVHMRTVALFTGRGTAGSTLMVNGRPEEPGAEAMVGLFLNMVPVAIRIEADTTWRDLVEQLVRAEQLMWRHRRTPFATLRALAPDFEPSTVFNYTEFHLYRELFDDSDRSLRLRQVTALDQTYLDLTVQCSLDPRGDRLRLSVDHRAPAVSVRDAENFLACLVHAARTVCADVDVRVEADRLPPEQVARLVQYGTRQQRPWPAELSLPTIVDGHAAARPDAVAVEDQEESFTYAELAGLSRCYAHGVATRTDAPHPVIGITASRSARFWAAVLGIWRAGGTYVPLPPNQPPARLAQMIDQAGVQMVFTDRRDRLPAGLLPASLTVLDLDSELHDDPVQGYVPQPLAEAAYVLFTSGSTGRPKGARIGPAAMLNHLWAKYDLLGLDEQAVVAQSAPASFDVSLWQFAAPWLVGGRAVVVPDDLLLDPPGLFDLLDARAVSVFETVPSHLAVVLEAIESGTVPWPRTRSSLSTLMATGESLPSALCRRWLAAGGVPIVNVYGPTECADDITHQVIADDKITGIVPIGRPIPNVTVQVTDAAGAPVPPGVEGELRVAGACLGLGYLDPGDEPGRFIRADGPAGSVTGYRTGDRVRFNAAGELLWLGRLDEEVKVRGRRIELGDLETHLRTHPGVSDAAAVVADSGRLRAVIAPRPGHCPPPDRDSLLRHLAGQLPAWMLPDDVVTVAALPVTSNGKLNRKSLAGPQFAPAGDSGQPSDANSGGAPGTEEGAAAAIIQEWAAITGRLPGIDSDFFADGGTSLDAVRLAARLSVRLGRTIGIADLLAAPRLAELTAALSDPQLSTIEAAAPAPRRARPVSGVIEAVCDDARELLQLLPERTLDAAAVGCLSPAALSRAGCSAQQAATSMHGAPVLRRVLQTPAGTIGHFLIPMTSQEIFTDPAQLAGLLTQTAEQARTLGADRTALTGLISAACDYGRALPEAGAGFTTGHDMTAAAVVLNVRRALRDTGTDLADHRLAVVGLGSIGHAATELLIAHLGHPAELTLIEAPTGGDRVNRTRQAIRAAGYDGPLATGLSTASGAPPQVYDSTLIIGAASATGLVDVARLAAGTIVVDDSAPHIFDPAAAAAQVLAGRLHVREGGVLSWPAPLREYRWIPTEPVLADVLAALRSYRPTPTTVMGCLIAALPALAAGAPPVIGEPTPAQTAATFARLCDLGFDGAPIMLEDTVLQAGGGSR